MGKIAEQTQAMQAKQTGDNGLQAAAKQSLSALLNATLDTNKMRGRFDELLGKRAPQFISSLVTMVNGSEQLKKCFFESPMSVISSALQAATYDLPIDPGLGFAYIVPFKANKKVGAEWKTVNEATFIIGYKGMMQLALRTGVYSRIPEAVDVRQGELISYDRLTGDAEFKWIEDEDARENLPIVGYAGYFRLKNGAEKTIYMSKAQIDAHERKNRKGEYMGKGWKENYDAMARKTVIRRLLSKYGLMSIEYRDGNSASVNLATAVSQGEAPDENAVEFVEYTDTTVDESTGEVIENGQTHAEG